MDKAAMMRGAVQEALAHMHAAGGTRITHVVLALVASDQVTEDAARQLFAMRAQGTPAQDATLAIEWLPAVYRCFSCLLTFSAPQSSAAVACPICGGAALEIGDADACHVRKVEIDDGATPSPGEALAPMQPD